MLPCDSIFPESGCRTGDYAFQRTKTGKGRRASKDIDSLFVRKKPSSEMNSLSSISSTLKSAEIHPGTENAALTRHRKSQGQRNLLSEQTGTKKGMHFTLVTVSGYAVNSHSEMVTPDDLFYE